MTHQLYTATGCTRCKITKRFMKENDIGYEAYDVLADGKEAFSRFYRANRKEIFRDKDGVEFPVFTDGEVIRQGLGPVVGYLIAGDGLSGFIGRSQLHGDWIDGFDISGGDPDRTDDLLNVLICIKQNGLKIQITTDGRNAAVLAAVKQKNLADRIIMELRGPAALYQPLTGASIEEDELKHSITLAARFAEYQLQTTIAPMVRQDGAVGYLTPEEVGEAARLIEVATGSKKHPYLLRGFDPAQAPDAHIRSVEPLPASAMFKYRTAAWRYMVLAAIQK